jgi:molybdate transport system substrate-binding protein
MRWAAMAAAGTGVLALLAGCGGSDAPPAGAPTQTLTVSAAASLKSVYTQFKTQFEQAHPGTTVALNFGGSDTLAQQIVQGAPADVLATASTKTMQTAQQAGKIDGQPVTYATNKLQIAVAPGDPKQIQGLPDLVRPGITTVVCAPAVPCGAAATAAEKAANVTIRPVSEEQDVSAVLQRVRTGTVDAGLVYVTDVKSANGAVQGVDFPQATAPGATQSYPIGVVTGSAQADLARSWIALVTGPQGKAALAQAGFAVTP